MARRARGGRPAGGAAALVPPNGWRAAQGWCRLKLVALHDLKALKGIRLCHRHVCVVAHRGPRAAGRPPHRAARAWRTRRAAGLQRARRTRRIRAAAAGAARAGSRAWSGAPLYEDLLFHRDRFELIDAVNGISDAGIAARVRGVADAQWPGEAWQLDAAALDGGLQLAVLYGQRMLGGPNLPMAIGGAARARRALRRPGARHRPRARHVPAPTASPPPTSMLTTPTGSALRS